MKVIVAPLHWGLGHASRCVPIVHQLIQLNYTPVIASDGAALSLLRQEFPNLPFLELPTYNIRYGKYLKWSLLRKVFAITSAVRAERKIIKNYVDQRTDVVGIISDNRFGVHHTSLPSVYITHQLKVKAGLLTPVASWLHRVFIHRFDACWIPDDREHSCSGELSNGSLRIPVKYIGILSRFQHKTLPQQWDFVMVLSGPEPNRSSLESALLAVFKNSSQRILLVQGLVSKEQKSSQIGGVTLVNFMLGKELETVLNQADTIVARSGYSTIMDLTVLQKKCVLIPTHGQNEQEYLAEYLSHKFGIVTLTESQIKTTDFGLLQAKAFNKKVPSVLDPDLFRLFQGK